MDDGSWVVMGMVVVMVVVAAAVAGVAAVAAVAVVAAVAAVAVAVVAAEEDQGKILREATEKTTSLIQKMTNST